MRPRELVLLASGFFGIAVVAVACNSLTGLDDYTKVACVGSCIDAQPEVGKPETGPDVEIDRGPLEDAKDAASEDAMVIPDSDPFDGTYLQRRWARWPMPDFANPDGAAPPAVLAAYQDWCPPPESDAGSDALVDADASAEADVGADAGGCSLEAAAPAVQDGVTFMLWEKSPPTEASSYLQAVAHCEALPPVSKWSVPTRIELVTLIKSMDKPTIEYAAFPGTSPVSYWTSSPFAGATNTDQHWTVDFATGEVTPISDDDNKNVLVRCVQPTNNPKIHYLSFGPTDDMVWDVSTNLEWKRFVSDVPTNRINAGLTCEAFPSDAGKPWRLPSMKELQSLVDEVPHQEYEQNKLVTKAIDRNAFPGTPAKDFWSSTDAFNGEGYVVNFENGQAKRVATSLQALARCVRTAK